LNTLGTIFKVHSFGESHGEYVGCVIDGCPAGLGLDIQKVQLQVNRRKTGKSNFASSRNEDDIVEIVSGVYENVTLGSPICILIKNKDAKSSDYDELKNVFRPSHGDFTNEMKYSVRDFRGGGRSSIRITAPLVAAGEIANQLLKYYVSANTTAFVSQIGDVALSNKNDYSSLDFSQIESSSVRCPDEMVSTKMLELIDKVNEQGNTLGGVITCVIQQVPIGLGEPIFQKLQSKLAAAMLSINTVKGFEFGSGFDSASMLGSESNDSFVRQDEKISTTTNHSGGMQSGISNGMDIYFHIAFKPISSIKQKQETIDKSGNTIELEIGGRHDVCAVPRAVPIIEAYTNIVLADAFLQNKISKL
jgi:chorismate synthase